MVRKYLYTCLFIICTVAHGCGSTGNYKKAVVDRSYNNVSIKLYGKRQAMTHSPGDLFSDNTYLDSLVIYTPVLKEGATDSINIPVPEGNYKIKGTIFVKGHTLTVRLFVNDTELGHPRPTDWNGRYIF